MRRGTGTAALAHRVAESQSRMQCSSMVSAPACLTAGTGSIPTRHSTLGSVNVLHTAGDLPSAVRFPTNEELREE
jgi:hypothetical protein